MTVYCFDRDHTVSTNPMPGRKHVPLSWVKWIFQETDDHVYATGNQHLRREALIPGFEEAVQRWELMNGYHPEKDYEPNSYFGYKPERRDGLRLIQDIHPEEEEFIVVDDVNLHDLRSEGFKHYYPWDFYNEVKEGEMDIPFNPDGYTDEPENANDINIEDFLHENGFMNEFLNI